MGVKKRAKSLGEKLIPISPEFYDTERDEDLVAPKNVLLPFNAFLLISQWIAFCILMWWYASPANNVLNTTIQAEWDYGRGTYNCTPMMKDDHYGNRFNFDTCQELARPPKISNPAAATDSVIWVEAKKGWKYVPYAHLPTKAAAYNDRTFSFESGIYADATVGAAAETKFKDDLANLNTCQAKTYGRVDSMGDGEADQTWYIKKYASGTWVDNPNAPTFSPGADCCPNHASACKTYTDAQDKVCKADSCARPTQGTPNGGCSANYENWNDWCQTYGERELTSPEYKYDNYFRQYQENVHEDFCMYGKIDGLLDKLTKLTGVQNWTKVLTRKEEINDMEIQQVLAQYDRSKTLQLCEVTEAEALAMFKLYYDSTFVCQYAKSGAPFGCESSTQLPISQCFSLAYANSLLLYTVFSAICVKIFFAAKKEEPEESAA